MPGRATGRHGRWVAAGVPRLHPAPETRTPFPDPAHRPRVPRRRHAAARRRSSRPPSAVSGSSVAPRSRSATRSSSGNSDPRRCVRPASRRSSRAGSRGGCGAESRRLLVLVIADPGHKDAVTPAETRLELARLAFASVPEAVVELDRHARTVDSLEERRLPDGHVLRPRGGRAGRLRELEGAAARARARPTRRRDAAGRSTRRGGCRAPKARRGRQDRRVRARAGADLLVRNPSPCGCGRADRRPRPSPGRRGDRAPRAVRNA